MNIEDFMSKLAAQAAPAESKKSFANYGTSQAKKVEKIYLNVPENFGRYQILPLNSTVIDYPFVTLFNTREVGIPKKLVQQDGTEKIYTSWVKFIPASAYQMKDASGRLVSSLTAEEEQLLNSAYTVFDQLWDEVGAKDDLQIQKSLVRKKNYTIFNGYALNKWSFADNRNPVRNNFAGLFVCTSKSFIQSVQDNLSECSVMNNGSYDFVEGIYNRNLTGRDGFIMMSISKNPDRAGFNVSVKHEYGRSQILSTVSIPQVDADLLQDPVAEFLGNQARPADSEDQPADQRRLFNPSVIKEGINFMTQQLSAVRMAKEAGKTVADAIRETNETVLANQKTYTPNGGTNDPMLKEAQVEMSEPAVNAEKVQSMNTEPFTTPAAGHFSPMGTPETTNNAWSQPTQKSAPFTTPSFSGFGSGQNDLPF